MNSGQSDKRIKEKETGEDKPERTVHVLYFQC